MHSGNGFSEVIAEIRPKTSRRHELVAGGVLIDREADIRIDVKRAGHKAGVRARSVHG